ncbi:MAG: hypothetical protein IPG16_02080 [Comamonadaceae bacterium]|jgi:hypothetical protein|nr:hypothetical protein [Comamonadaceae bacterium]
MILDLVFFPGAITRFIWVLLACLVLVVVCGALWIVGGFIVGLVENACMERRDQDKRRLRR